MSLVQQAQGLAVKVQEYFTTPPPTAKEGFRLLMKKAMPLCPICGGAMDGHLYQQVASLSFKEGNSERLRDLFQSYQFNQWEGLTRCQEWDGTLDNAVVWLFRCPDGRHNLTIFYDPYELWESASLLRHKEITADDLPMLRHEWQRI